MGSGYSKASSSRNLSTAQLKTKETQIRERMKQLYNANNGFANKNASGVEEANKKWNELRNQANQLRDTIAKREEEERKKRTSKNDNASKTFVNSYGEATNREITSSTYRRQQKRMERAVRRNLGR